MRQQGVCNKMRGRQGGFVKLLYGTDPSIQLSSERAGLLQVSNEDLVLRIQNGKAVLFGPEVVASSGQEIPGGDLVSGGIGSGEGGAVDRQFNEARSHGSGRVVLDLDVLGDLDERGDDLTVELGNSGDDTLEALPEIGSREGEIHDGVSEGDGGEDVAECDVSDVDRGAVSTGIGDGGIGVGSTVPLDSIGDGITNVAFTFLASGFVKKYVGLPDNLVGEGGEGNSPLADLILELCVDGRGIGDVDRTAAVFDDTALVVEANVESTEVFTPPICGDDKDLLAIQVLLNRGVGTQSASEVAKGCVGVTADDEVEALGVLGKFLILVVADVGHGDDALG